MTGTTHRYIARTTWMGSTRVGYAAYDRTHAVTAPPAEAGLQLSSDAAFGGDPSRLNPEQLLVAALSSCQLLSFLAVAARAQVDVVSYEDDAEGMMSGEERPMWVSEVVLRPIITVTGAVTRERVRHLCEVAHRECFIANSVRTDVRVEPTVVVQAGQL